MQIIPKCIFILIFLIWLNFHFFPLHNLCREVAQLKLAEQILADKEHHLQHSEYRADMAQMEKEALQEELVAIKSIHNASLSSSIHETSQHEAGGTPTRVSFFSSFFLFLLLVVFPCELQCIAGGRFHF